MYKYMLIVYIHIIVLYVLYTYTLLSYIYIHVITSKTIHIITHTICTYLGKPCLSKLYVCLVSEMIFYWGPA